MEKQQNDQVGKQQQQRNPMAKLQQRSQQLSLVYKSATTKTKDIVNVEALHLDSQPMFSN